MRLRHDRRVMCFLLLALLLGVVKAHGQPMEIVSYANYWAAIVVADEPDGGAVEAAGLLQRYIQRMTDHQLAIQTVTEYEKDPWQSPIAICVGRSKLTDEMGIDVAQEAEGDDRYVLKTDAERKRVAIVGNDGGDRRGSVYGVYDILERYGCGWYGTDPLWQIVPYTRHFSIAPVDVDERAAFRGRYIWLVNNRVLRDAWRMGGRSVNPGHALGWVVSREKYFAEHPEHFGRIQPCLSNPAVMDIATELVAERIKAAKGWMHYESFTAIDDGGFCECEKCKAVGNISARMLNFANQVAERLDRDEQNRGKYEIWFLAYWHTHEPPQPMSKAHSSVKIMMVNEGNHAKPLDEPEDPHVAATTSRNNTREVTDMAGWQETGGLGGVYEWWIPNIIGEGENRPWRVAPWYSGDTALRNQRYWRDRGIKYLSYETKFELGDGYPRRWALWYVGAQGMWNPDRTSADILREPCRRLFGDTAGPLMLDYYLTLEKALLDTQERNGNWALPALHLVYTPEVVEKATALIDQAAAAADTPERQARIAQEKSIWAATGLLISGQRSVPRQTFRITLDGESAEWVYPKITETDIHSLFGVNEGVPLYAVEADGQTREAKAGESFDLSTGVTFSTKAE